MRRSLILSTILAASVAVLGACDPKTNVPEKPTVATPTPVLPASPLVSPTASPAKPVASPEVEKTDGKNTNKNSPYIGPPIVKQKNGL